MADKKKYSELESGIRGAAETGALGFADEIEGAARAAKDAYDAKSFSKLKEMLGPRIDEARRAAAEAQTQNPKSYMAGQGAGLAASALLPGGALAAGSLKGAAAAGAAYGGLAGLGNADVKDLSSEELQRAGKNAAFGAGVGGALGPLAKGLADEAAPLANKGISKFEKLMAELKPRSNLPGAAPQRTAEELVQDLVPIDAKKMGISNYAYEPQATDLERMAGRRLVNSQLPPEAPTLNVPSDTVNLGGAAQPATPAFNARADLRDKIKRYGY